MNFLNIFNCFVYCRTKNLGGGATRNLNAGQSRKTGVRGTTRKRTAGYTTTGTHGATNVDFQVINGIEVNVRPKPLMKKRDDHQKEEMKEKESGKLDGSQSGASQQLDSQKSQDPNKKDIDQGISGAKGGEDKKKESSVNS